MKRILFVCIILTLIFSSISVAAVADMPEYQTLMFSNAEDLIGWIETMDAENFQIEHSRKATIGRYYNGISSLRELGKILIPSFEGSDMRFIRIEVFPDTHNSSGHTIIGFYYSAGDRSVSVTVVEMDYRYADIAEKEGIGGYAAAKYSKIFADATVIQTEKEVKYPSIGIVEKQVISYAFATSTGTTEYPMDSAFFLIDGFEVKVSQNYKSNEQKWDEKYINDLSVEIAPVVVSEMNTSRITVEKDSRILYFNPPPYMEKNRVLVPYRRIFDAFGAVVSCDSETQTITATLKNKSIIMQIDNPEIIVNGKAIILDVPARLIGENVFVPIRAVSESLGARVYWNGKNKMVIIYT